VTSDLPRVLGGTAALAAADHGPWPVITEHERRAVLGVLDRGVLSGANAPEARAFEEEFASYVGARRALLTNSGTSALVLALAAADVGEGDEVVVPAYSFVATPLAVALQGAVPVFADVDPVSGHVDLASVEAALGPRTKAMMPVHVHGAPADLDAALALGRRAGIVVVEDAAQAHGATLGGRPVGALGVAGGFSLQSSKNLPAGEGGVFVTNDLDRAEVAERVRSFGQEVARGGAAAFDESRPLDGAGLGSQVLGSMYRGNELMAAFARAQLARLPELTRRCQENAARLSARLCELPGVTPPPSVPGRASVHHKYRVHLDPARASLRCTPRELRDAMLAALRAEGCEVVLWQTDVLPAQPIFQRRAGSPFRSLPGGTDLAANYDPARYPGARRLIEGSIVLFSQSRPLIAQSSAVVERYADAFARVWRHREAIVARAVRG
jgi:dTDP-4-amino-4,6-dideoxygalactose transaminase